MRRSPCTAHRAPLRATGLGAASLEPAPSARLRPFPPIAARRGWHGLGPLSSLSPVYPSTSVPRARVNPCCIRIPVIAQSAPAQHSLLDKQLVRRLSDSLPLSPACRMSITALPAPAFRLRCPPPSPSCLLWPPPSPFIRGTLPIGRRPLPRPTFRCPGDYTSAGAAAVPLVSTFNRRIHRAGIPIQSRASGASGVAFAVSRASEPHCPRPVFKR